MKILGIDDNQDLLDLCKVVLSSEGYEYTGVIEGKEGLEEIRNGNYDLVLLDLSMPEFSGIDVIDALDKDGLMKKQKIVIFQMEKLQTELRQHICMLHQSCLDRTYFKETFQVLQESQKLLSEIDVKRF